MISCGFKPLMIPRFSLRAAHSHSKKSFSSWNLKKRCLGCRKHFLSWTELSFKNILKSENFLLCFSFPVLFLPQIPLSLSNQTVGEMEKKNNKKWETEKVKQKERKKSNSGTSQNPSLTLESSDWQPKTNTPKTNQLFQYEAKMKVTLFLFFCWHSLPTILSSPPLSLRAWSGRQRWQRNK